jgi:predicted Zn finger-like uncharacterized protein
MIIGCKNCLKKFVVKDSDIGINGRLVKCGNCSSQWLQRPIPITIKTKKSVSVSLPQKIRPSDHKDVFDKKEILETRLTGSDGKKYKFLGNQWAELLPSGKTGRLARKKISVELNKSIGKKISKHKKIISKSNKYQEKQKKGMGLFSLLIVLIMFISAVVLFLDTFKNQIIPFWPKLEIYLVYIFETINNIYIIIKDLFNNYK